MTASEAEAYHAEQIGWLVDTKVEVVSGYTIACPEEGIGLVRATRARGLPAVIALTVETDRCLPVGTPLGEAIKRTERETDGHALHHMINCAHPDHFAPVLAEARGPLWMERLRGLVVNASRCSHAELDVAEELDDGDPDELADQVVAHRRTHPHLAVPGGCCGTDIRHLRALTRAVADEAA